MIAQNKKALYNYFVIESLEVGIELYGTEVKSVRSGRINLKDSWCSADYEQLTVNNMHISHYEKGNIFNVDPVRSRKLLAHKKEISHLCGAVKRQGFSLIPISAYFKGKWAKLKLGLCKGKKIYDKRESEAKKDSQRNIRRALKENLN
ncbi:MAG: SsrA-binding protein SmpB [Oscillospiraceae bacterium]|nr:SsrA-binding protein SmpB [Oscillospiraceae bacterium]